MIKICILFNWCVTFIFQKITIIEKFGKMEWLYSNQEIHQTFTSLGKTQGDDYKAGDNALGNFFSYKIFLNKYVINYYLLH